MTPTIQQIINLITSEVPGAPLQKTVDTIIAGDPAQNVTGIVTTFLANQNVLQRAVDLGANFIIPHEPVFYNHFGEIEWLYGDPVYEAKRQFIDDHGLTIWRFHDYWHRHIPDGIVTGVLRALEWTEHIEVSHGMAMITLPALSLRALVTHCKTKLGAESVRVIGSPDMPCSKIGLLVGFPGAQRQISALNAGIDVLVTGELNEWETCEYVRDALAQGRQMGLIVLGHANSEEAGMAYLVEWLRERLAEIGPDVPITHVPTGDPFRVE